MKTRHTSTHKICLVLIQSNLLEKLLKEYSISLFTRNWPDPGLTYSERMLMKVKRLKGSRSSWGSTLATREAKTLKLQGLFSKAMYSSTSLSHVIHNEYPVLFTMNIVKQCVYCACTSRIMMPLVQ